MLNQTFDICCIGHITLDKVVTQQNVTHMAGGTSYYFSNALQHMDLNYCLVTSLAQSEMPVVEELKSKGIHVEALISAHSVYFENSYAHNQDHRNQRVLQKADPFTIAKLQGIEARLFHLGPLLADDLSLEVIKYLANKGQLSLDVQGFLREVRNQDVYAVDWPEKKEALKYINILKANEHELEVLTHCTNLEEGILQLADWGVAEVVITLGSMGSVIYTDRLFYTIPAYPPAIVTDATGCGDTYMAGYLYQRALGTGVDYAGKFAAAMASLKIEKHGPFTGTSDDVLQLLHLH
jgi:sugar/nucleoside kinase (ribokinase family)